MARRPGRHPHVARAHELAVGRVDRGAEFRYRRAHGAERRRLSRCCTCLLAVQIAESGQSVGLVQLADLLLDSVGRALDWFSGLFPLVRHTTESRDDEVAVKVPVEARDAAAQRLESAQQWRDLYLLHRNPPLAERDGYAALQVAVQRVAVRDAWLIRPERRG